MERWGSLIFILCRGFIFVLHSSKSPIGNHYMCEVVYPTILTCLSMNHINNFNAIVKTQNNIQETEK